MIISGENIISIKKLVTTGSKQFYESTPSITGVQAYIEQMQPELTPMFNGYLAYDKYMIFVDFTADADGNITPNIQNKDRIIDENNNEYAVEGVQVFFVDEIPQHLQIMANKKFNPVEEIVPPPEPPEFDPRDIESIVSWIFSPEGTTPLQSLSHVEGQTRPVQNGKAYSFNGVNQFVDYGTNSDFGISGDMTVCGWIKLDDLGSNQNALLTKMSGPGNRGYCYRILSSGIPSMTYYESNSGTGLNGSTVLETNKWYHLTFVRGLTSQKIYIDGVEDASASVSASVWDVSSVRAITGGGFSSDNISDYLDGKIADLRVYNKSLSTQEIEFVRTNGDSGTDPTLTNCKLWLKCDEGSGTTSFDSSGNSNDGTIINLASGFHAEDITVPYSWQNQVGYTDNAGILVPRDESNITLDVQGNPLQYTGEAKFNGTFVNSPCLNLNGSNQYFDTGIIPDSGSSKIEVSFFISSFSSNGVFAGSIDSSTNRFYIGIRNVSGSYVIAGGFGDQSWITIQGTTALEENTFYTASIEYDATNIILKLNGEIEYNQAKVGSVSTISHWVGGINSNSSLVVPISGSVCDITISNNGISEAHYPCSEKAGIRVHDVSGNGNHGTIQNPASNNWTETQDVFHYNILNGFSKLTYFNATDGFINTNLTDSDLDLIVNGTTRFKIVTQDSEGLIGSDSNTQARYFFCWQDGSSSPLIDREVGINVVYTIDGIVFNGNRGQLHDLIADGQEHDIEITQLDLTVWQELLFMTYAAGFAQFRVDGSIYDVSLDFTSNGTNDIVYTGYGIDDWNDRSGNSYNATVSNGFNIEIPALLDGSSDSIGGTIKNPSGNWHNDASTLIKYDECPEVFACDVSNTLFDSNGDANNVDIYSLPNDVSLFHKIMHDNSVENQSKNLMLFNEPVSGQNLDDLREYLNIGSGLLDQFPGSSAAYSLRNLSESTTNVIRIRRSSDNAEQDFTATQISDGTLLSFVGSGDGFVSVWYDQSGNNNDSQQASNARQPIIVESGNLVIRNGLPAFKFDGIDDRLSLNNGINIFNGISVFKVDGRDGLNTISVMLAGLAGTAIYDIHIFTDNRAYIRNKNGFGRTGILPAGQNLSTTIMAENTTRKLWLNGVSQSISSSFVSATPNDFDTIGAYSVFSRAYLQEMIVWQSQEDSIRTSIESDLNNYYNIF